MNPPLLSRNKPYYSVAPGPQIVQLPTHQFGTLEAIHADETAYISHTCDNGNSWIGIGFVMQDPNGKDHVAVYASLTPAEAREHAFHLLTIANKLDAEKGKQ